MPVIQLATERRKRARDLYGPASCLVCGYDWVSTALSGTKWLKCPKCGTNKGVFVGPIAPPDDHFACRCGNEVFYVGPEGMTCPICALSFPFNQTQRDN